MVETKVLREAWDVDRRLNEMGLTREKLLDVRDIARSAASNVTAFHATNAAGTFAYQDGTWALRDRFVEDGWHPDRTDGVEAIKNDALNLRIAFCNVDISCDDEQKPKPRSSKGAGAERVCSGNLFGSLREYAPAPTVDVPTYYLMVDDGGAVELTCPVIRSGTFRAYIERIYLSDGSDMDAESFSLNDSDRVDQFDPEVARR